MTNKDLLKKNKIRKIKIYLAQIFSLCALFFVFSNLKTLHHYFKTINISFKGEKTHASSLLKGLKPTKDQDNKINNTIDSEKEVRLLKRAREAYNLIKIRESRLKKKENDFKKMSKILDAKIKQLEKTEKDIKKSLETVDAKEKEKIHHLVKVIELMKPKNASAIFNELPIENAIHLARHMNEKKLSDIFANMKVDKAKTITLALLESKNLYAVAK
jgi:flagellar motility protein MotE (MotC chaperone)